MILLGVKFAACVAVIAIAGNRVAKYGDVIAEKTGLGGLWIGVVLMAIATSLPELFTGISAVAFVGEPDITIGDLFGASTFNLLNLGLLDVICRRGPLLAQASKGHLVAAGMSLVLISFGAAGILTSGVLNLRIGWIGIYTPIIILSYLGMVWMIYNYEQRQRAQDTADAARGDVIVLEEAEGTLQYRDISLRRAYIGYAIAAVCIIAAGTWLAFIGDEIADATGLGTSFIGSLLIGFTTTLPEITVSFSAMRLGAIDMCVANMIGSNLFNMTIIGIDDLFYTKGPVLAHVSPNHVFTALVAVVMTGIFVAALMSPPQRKTPLRASWYALAFIAVFVVGAFINFRLAG